MEVHRLTSNYIESNTYLINGEGEEAVIVDAGGGTSSILKYIDEHGLKPTHLLLTHGHYDHIGAAKKLIDNYGLTLAIHKNDADMLNDPLKNALPFDYDISEIPEPDILLEDGDVVEAAGLVIDVIHTPGHTPGSVCYTCGKYLFSGDTLFYESIGRTDLPGGSFEDMKRSLEKLCSLQEDFIVCPGHGNSTTLAAEKAGNPYLNL